MKQLSLFLAFLFVSSASFALVIPQEQELEKALQELEDARSSGKKIAEALEKLESELGNLQDETAALAKAIQRNEADLQEKDSSLSILTAEKDKKSQELATQQEAFNKMVGTLLQMQRVPKAALLDKDKTLQEQLRASSVADTTLRHIQTQADSLQIQQEELDKISESVQEAKTELEKEQTVLFEQRERLSGKLRARESVYSKTKNNHSSVQKRIGRLAKESSSLKSLLAKLEAEREQLKTIGVPQPKPRRKKSRLAKAEKPLRLPALGEVTSRYGEEQIPGETLKGILVQTAKTATVTAPQSGEVAFTGPFLDYGNMVIIRHDARYHMLIAGLEETFAKVGQKVIRGEPIGKMGKTPPKQTELYLELRKDGKPIDPMGWIGKDAG